MRSTRMCLQVTGSAILLVGCLTLSFGLCSPESEKIEPTGTDIGGAIQFDAIIELNRYTPRSLHHDYALIFASYWVARDSYSIAVVWTEPQSTDMFFAARPGLSISSNEHSFNICHQTKTKSDEAYKKPLSQRDIFRHKFGGYPIDNIRFAEREAMAERIYITDIKGSKDFNQPDREVMDLSVSSTESGNARDVSRINVQTNGERIDSIKLFNANNQVIKDINYEYDKIKSNNCLRKLTAVLPESPMTVGFNTGSMKVTLDGKEYNYREFEVPHHSGGRRCTVEYETVTLGNNTVSLPVHVTVRAGKDERILRCVHLSNFRKTELDAAGVTEAARQFAAFTDEQRKYQEFRSKYWDKRPDSIDIDKADIEAIGQLRTHIEKEMAVSGDSIGEKLKYMNILMELDLICIDVVELDRHYQRYLSTLADRNLFQMVLVGGYGVIETAMFRGRRSEAGKLLSRWVDASLETNDDASILLFAKRQLAKRRLWSTALLLEAFLIQRKCPIEIRFEAQVLRCSAIHELYELLQIDNIVEKGLIAKVQADWVESIGKDGLKEILEDDLNQAKQLFAAFDEPTREQKVLRAQLEKIDSGM